MKLAIMQPYFFPYIGYFDLIHQTDLWVVYDTGQYIKHGWVNRNRILHPREGWWYVIVPLKHHHFTTPIREVRIAEDRPWRQKLLGQIQHYGRKAPFFPVVRDLLHACLHDTSESLSRLNVRCLEEVTRYLGIPFQHSTFSEMGVHVDQTDGPTSIALQTARALGATEYVNRPGGAHLFDPRRFEEAGITLTIQGPVDFVYDCDGYQFQPNLSIIDVMMWNPPDEIRRYLVSRQEKEQT